MQGGIAYRQLVLLEDGAEKIRLPLAAPVNDLLGQLRPSEAKALTGYTSWLSVRYGALGASTKQQGVLGPARDRSVQEAFRVAAKQAVKGSLSSSVAEHLERLRFAADGSVADVHDLAALAAWSLLEAIRRQPLKLFTCPLCKAPFLGQPDGPRYCQRVAPGQVTRDCRTMDYEKRLTSDSAYRAYRREYKRLTEQFRRQQLDVAELISWREENGPARWQPFDEWKARKGRAARRERTRKEKNDG